MPDPAIGVADVDQRISGSQQKFPQEFPKVFGRTFSSPLFYSAETMASFF